MAQTYEEWKKSYESMNDTQKQQYNDILKNKWADYIGNKYMSQYNQSSTPASTTSTSTSVAKPEYQWSWTTWTKSSAYQNQWEWDYYYNPQTQYYEKKGTSGAGTSSWTKVETPETPKTTVSSDLSSFWNNLSYQQQQDYLAKNSWLKQSLAAKWLTIKQPEAEWTKWEETPTTPSWDGWDYQDNSPERMKQMADNVNNIYQSDPYIFNSEDSFRKFFIDWKWRTKEQEEFLMDLYKNRKRYNELDNKTADEVWYLDTHWWVPESYLTYLKNSNPERYAAVMDAIAKEKGKIEDQSWMDTISTLTWDGKDTITSKAIEWLKSVWLFVDEDWNLIDDRTENYATEEEQQYAKDAADIIARNLDIDNTIKHTYDDLVKAYPWATKATLMAMAQDINSDLLREKENNNVELTRLQWYIDYMQSERQERNTIWQNAINQLQKQYWMYYEYSPEWMAELLDAQYQATSPSLSSVEWWTESQKRRALDNILTGYYDKYWTIIERPKEQVISDVIAYANNKWITLEQALKENFIEPLRAKDQYSALSSWWWTWWKFASYEWADGVKHTIRYNDAGDWEEIFWEDVTYWSDGTVKFWESIRTWDTIWNDINSIWHILASDDGIRVGTYKSTNWYTYNVYANREDWIKATENLLRRWYYWMTLQDAAQKWIWQWKDISWAKQVIKDTWLWLNDKLSDANVRKFIEAIWTWEGTLSWQSLDDWAKQWVNDFSQYKQSPISTEFWYWENPMTNTISMIRVNWDLNSDEKKDLNFASKAYELMYELASSWDIDYLINSDEWQKFISNLKSASFTKNNEDATWTQVYNALKNNITDQRNLRTVNKLINIIELKLRKTSWAAIAASEWNSNFDMLLPWVNEIPSVSLDKYRTFEKVYLMDYFNSAGSKTKWYKYIPLFSEDSPYYIKHKEAWQRFPTSNKWAAGIRELSFSDQSNYWTWQNYNDIYSQIWFNS